MTDDEIVVEKRIDGWIAYLKSNKAIWEYGRTASEAVDKMNVTLGDEWYKLLGLS
jgi:hypothetical protein